MLKQEHGTTNDVVGQCLGWMMAAIYMGGRIPQIYLNVSRELKLKFKSNVYMFILFCRFSSYSFIILAVANATFEFIAQIKRGSVEVNSLS